MANIMKDDVRTYVEELIKNEFMPKNNEEKFLSDNPKRNTGKHCNVHKHSESFFQIKD